MANKQIMVISVMDRDRPGIVAEVTEGISTLGGNLADLRESVLCGYFTMILVASFPADVSVETVELTLAKETSSRVSVEPAQGSLTEAAGSEEVYVLSAVGRDRVGLVAQVSRFCCNRGVNVLDLASHVDADQYTMMLQLDLSGIQCLEDFKTELSTFGKTTGLNLVLQHNDIFRATNEI
ncbi:ACT domain-containing protein [Pontiellaceae bacterium B1224]|nr:ACT domain-containing protein [Pontiellaceae bacterium B1224]